MDAPQIVVDAANVIGSRPDGWWRDRAGAAERLLAELRRRHIADEAEVTVVLEGAARAGAEVGSADGLSVVHAAGSGDDAIVDLVAAAVHEAPDRPVIVVTADRELRHRVEVLGAQTQGPRWLFHRLDGTC
ncbi:MAG: hypothetical protein ACRDOJ_12645 [Nocardioidaceae bacterium]